MSAVGFSITDQLLPNDVRVVELGGEVDLRVASRLGQYLHQLSKDGPRHLVIDLSRVTFIDSTTIRVLKEAAQHQRQAGASLALACGRPKILEIFEIVAMERVCPIYRSRRQAVARLAGVP